MDKNSWVWHREVSVLLFSFLNSFTQVLEWFISSSTVDPACRVLLGQSLPFSMMDGKHHVEKLQLDHAFETLELKDTWKGEQQNCFQNCPLPVLSPNPLSCVLLCVFPLTSILLKIMKRLHKCSHGYPQNTPVLVSKNCFIYWSFKMASSMLDLISWHVGITPPPSVFLCLLHEYSV